ncbi:helix-turn-helix transcriptional regulator [Cryptosporangium aurantiacum]|uniref:Predicted transcriptional regulator YheO, contains PAS and DNA-binding HTH domains n=1 Tax=Cryptosporangium aurantiacum TaxID=134849 RepID=A0A1M7KF16_9ACTN|nr:PAS domain-containing protein [Cryptosporangium aurantiacum]SHM63898.1 Predicted transcriptional regulator YheO, contains PAS and DNA-binding HTH domains [Cryptosporangium aurantiacum]
MSAEAPGPAETPRSADSWATPEFAAAAARVVDAYRPLVEPLAQAVGPGVEVVLHDLSKLPNSVVAIAGGLSGRTVGAPATDLGLRLLMQDDPPESIIGYRTELPGGIVCRSSTIFLRGEGSGGIDAHRPVAALCLNRDIGQLVAARDLLTALVDTPAVSGHDRTETFYASVENLTEDLLRRAIATVGVDVAAMSKADKTRVVKDLESRGFFLIKESVEIAAKALGVSRYTIYNYLND